MPATSPPPRAQPWGLPFQAFAGLLVCALLTALPVPSAGFWPRAYLANLPMPTLAAWNAPDAAPLSPVAMTAGVGGYLETGCPAPQVPRALAELEKLPVQWVRNEIPWAGVEPVRGQYEWERWDRVVNGLRARDFQILGALCYWNNWVDRYSDAGIEEFGRYAERVARRYRGSVAAWEIWNEPNEATFWQSTPERYVLLMRAAYQGVKRGNPDAVVVGGSLSGADLTYLRKLLRLGALQWMDVLAIHPYSFGWAPEDARLIAELRGIAAEMRRAGGSDQLWVTEIGIGISGEAKQARLLERTWALLQQSGVVSHAFWYTLYVADDGAYPLYRADWTPKRAVQSFQRVAGQLKAAKAAGSALPADLQVPWASGNPQALSPLQVWRFERGAEIKRLSWCPGGWVTVPDPAVGAPAVFGPQPFYETLARPSR